MTKKGIALKFLKRLFVKPKLVFVVEDNLVYAKSLEAFIRIQFPEIRVSIFQDGESCLQHLHEKPLLIIMDHILNSKNDHAATGLKTIQTIKSASFNTNILLLSTNTDLDVFVKALSLYDCTFMKKGPLTFKMIAHHIEQLK